MKNENTKTVTLVRWLGDPFGYVVDRDDLTPEEIGKALYDYLEVVETWVGYVRSPDGTVGAHDPDAKEYTYEKALIAVQADGSFEVIKTLELEA